MLPLSHEISETAAIRCLAGQDDKMYMMQSGATEISEGSEEAAFVTQVVAYRDKPREHRHPIL